MKITIACFASSKYWKNRAELEETFNAMKKEFCNLSQDVRLVDDSFDFEAFNNNRNDLLIAIPMSGAVQPKVLQASKLFDSVLIFAGYVKGTFADEISRKMLIYNAAPAVMDVYAVLKRESNNVFLCVSKDELTKHAAARQAVDSMKGERILAIGKTEPWVISSVREWSLVKEKFGIEIIDVEQRELVELYNETCGYESFADKWTLGATSIVEPTAADISNAARFQTALVKLIEKYSACGAAIACFDMLKTGTTACLGVSYINTNTDYVVSCEGDMDSALTMLLMKRISKNNVWMANPNIQPDNTVNFVHCTAPTVINGTACKYTLRNHHESGIGVSTQVELPENVTVTACRISNNLSQITINRGVGYKGEYEPSCRTQLKVAFDDFKGYIKNALGCHQIFVFSDIKEELTYAAELLGLEIL